MHTFLPYALLRQYEQHLIWQVCDSLGKADMC